MQILFYHLPIQWRKIRSWGSNWTNSVWRFAYFYCQHWYLVCPYWRRAHGDLADTLSAVWLNFAAYTPSRVYQLYGMIHFPSFPLLFFCPEVISYHMIQNQDEYRSMYVVQRKNHLNSTFINMYIFKILIKHDAPSCSRHTSDNNINSCVHDLDNVCPLDFWHPR
jgi:hypothetical protein